MALTQKREMENIDCINGIKVLSAIWIIIGHRMDMMIDNPIEYVKLMSSGQKIILKFAQMFTSVVDIFFLISGILVTQKCLKLFTE